MSHELQKFDDGWNERYTLCDRRAVIQQPGSLHAFIRVCRDRDQDLFRLKYSLNRLRKDRNTNWRVKATAYTRQGVSMRGFPAKLEGEEGEEQFWFEGGSDADRRVRVEIQGAWLQNLPWHREAPDGSEARP